MGGPTEIGVPESIYMCANETDGNLVPRKIEMTVCGLEEIELKTGKTTIYRMNYT